ncbi:WavE lipopolysaccharide synthesis family protein [Psychrobacter sp.]|uniref:WavE lipopolysaccharide synthesis family protein n=1 Tax=Psychrobacter sp. TaxID=56811 RepID=UPI0025FFF54B|nr:WavE lipopolysaccharide synthesis family protein [Psychrobacter sp.]
MIKTSQVTLVFQGYVHTDSLGSGVNDGLDLLYNIAKSRESYPDASIIVSTWDNTNFPDNYNTAEKLGIDALILSPDPGGLPNIKFGYDTPNNVNRQIVTTKAGLDAVTTEYAIKLRTDSFLTSAELLNTLTDYTDSVVQSRAQSNIQDTEKNTEIASKKTTEADYSPIVVSSYFSIDPMVYEHMAYHISDWMQFAKTDILQKYWSLDLMPIEDATYYERHSHDKDTNQDGYQEGFKYNNQSNEYTDDTFRTRLAVEQYITTTYAKSLGFTVPNTYNEMNDQIIDDFKRYVAEHIIIADNEQIGFELPKYSWVNADDFMALNCLSHADWYQLFILHHNIDNPNVALLSQAQSRTQQKNSLDANYNLVSSYPVS